MKYLCLCYYDVDITSRLSPEEGAKIGPACHPYDALLQATGKVVVSASLSAPESWSYWVPKNGKPHHAKGRYLPGSQQAGAFFILEAESEEEALRAASNHAAANYGEHLGFAVEVRACESYDTFTGTVKNATA